jgi:hypothetical protein
MIAFALAGRTLPARYETLARLGQAEEVPVVPWVPGGPLDSAGAVVEVIKERPDTQVPTRAILSATLMITQSFLWQYPVQGRLDSWTARRNYPVCGCGRLRWPQPWKGSAA